MKQILYNTESQTMVNRAVHSKGRREKGKSVKGRGDLNIFGWGQTFMGVGGLPLGFTCPALIHF